MVRRSAEAWRELVEAQGRSGKSAAMFCRERRLCPECFSMRKKALGQSGQVEAPFPFVRLEPIGAEAHGAVVRLRLGRCEWEFSGMALEDLARLMAGLA